MSMKIKRNWKKVDPKELEGIHEDTDDIAVAYVNRHNPNIHVEVIRGAWGPYRERFNENRWTVNLPFGWANGKYDTKKQAISALKNWMVDNPSGGVSYAQQSLGEEGWKKHKEGLTPDKSLLKKWGIF